MTTYAKILNHYVGFYSVRCDLVVIYQDPWWHRPAFIFHFFLMRVQFFQKTLIYVLETVVFFIFIFVGAHLLHRSEKFELHRI